MSSDDKPFSVRTGIIPERAMQTEKLDDETLRRIVNTVVEHVTFNPEFDRVLAKRFFAHKMDGSKVLLYRSDIKLHMCRGLSAMSQGPFGFGKNFPREVLDLLAVPERWWAVLEFIEFVLDIPVGSDAPIVWITPGGLRTGPNMGSGAREHFVSSLTSTLSEMNVGYRLLPTGKFVNVHSDEEVEEIGKACSGPFAEARTHMENAVADFRNTDQPNHANTVKEAISAVESIVKELTGKEDIKAGLHQLAEKGIVPDIRPHPNGDKPFVTALEKYWTYANATSRHGRKKGVEPPDRDTARFLLVTCATLVNYITTRHLAAGKSS